MGNSTEKPKIKIVVTPFVMKENVKDMEVPPKAKEYQMSIGNAEQEFVMNVQDGGIVERDGNNIKYEENGTIKSGKLVSSEGKESKKQSSESVVSR